MADHAGFLKGEGLAVDLDRVDQELTALWGPAAERIGGPELEHPHLTRLVLANLVVLGDVDCAVLDDVVTQHPCRTILLDLNTSGIPDVKAEISALCHLPAPGQPQVCSERITLSVDEKAFSHLPAAVRFLLEPDLPVILWCVGSPLPHRRLIEAIMGDVTRVLMDPPDPDASATFDDLAEFLENPNNKYVHDASWFGITPWRELIAKLFDAPACRALQNLSEIRIRTCVPTNASPGIPRIAAYLVGWLAGQLGWVRVTSVIESATRTVNSTFRTPSGDVKIQIHVDADPKAADAQISEIAFTTQSEAGPQHYSLTRRSCTAKEVHHHVESPDSCGLPRIVIAPEFDRAGRINAALESARNDPPFQRAWPIARELLTFPQARSASE